MSFAGGFLNPPSPRIPSIRSPRLEDYDSSSSTDSTVTEPARDSSYHRPRITFAAASSATASSPTSEYLFPIQTISGRSSISSTASSTPIPSRSGSPLPQFYSSGPPSSCASDTDSEPGSPLVGIRPRSPWRWEERRRWWAFGSPSRSRRRRSGSVLRSVKRTVRRVVRHPFFPRQPITIVLTLLLLTTLGVLITLLLIHILNPDKEPLPWRAYCSVPSTSTAPDFSNTDARDVFSFSSSGVSPAPFPPSNLDSLPPAGLFIGVFSMDSALERRMLIRSTWASHARSRNGAGDGDDGNGTSRTIVRFILGQPRKNWERRIKYEQDLYKDIIILPMVENMNAGKSHAFFSWAAEEAWVPPYYFNTSVPPPPLTYSNITASAPPLSLHDPVLAWKDREFDPIAPWVRPDFVIKVDDDSFVMLAELEARLRLELHHKSVNFDDPSYLSSAIETSSDSSLTAAAGPTASAFGWSMILAAHNDSTIHAQSLPSYQSSDPLVYYGYLVKNRFMAGELYGLSWSLVDWVSKDATVKTMTKGAEDKQTAKWMQIHPRASEVRWSSERCWIYDHPRAGTVYSHGFLFPSEVTRVRRGIVSYPNRTPQDVVTTTTPSTWSPVGTYSEIPPAWSYSTVTTFGQHYTAPLLDLTYTQSVEAMIEGSDMSTLREGSPMTPEYAWLHREGRRKRYESKRVGGTVVIHFIKKHMWFLEAALAMLDGEEYSEFEKFSHGQGVRSPDSAEDVTVDPETFARALAKHRKR